MAQLAQAYIHLKPLRTSGKNLKRLGRYAEPIAVKIAGDIYGGGVVVDVELKEVDYVGDLTADRSLLIASHAMDSSKAAFVFTIKPNDLLSFLHASQLRDDHVRFWDARNNDR